MGFCKNKTFICTKATSLQTVWGFPATDPHTEGLFCAKHTRKSIGDQGWHYSCGAFGLLFTTAQYESIHTHFLPSHLNLKRHAFLVGAILGLFVHCYISFPLETGKQIFFLSLPGSDYENCSMRATVRNLNWKLHLRVFCSAKRCKSAPSKPSNTHMF